MTTTVFSHLSRTVICSALVFGSLVAEAAFSLPTNGIYVAVSSPNPDWPATNTTVRWDERLGWSPFSDKGRVPLMFAVDPAYFAKLKLLDSQGKEVPRTRLGRTYGSKFDKLKSYKTTRLQGVSAWGSYHENKGLGAGIYLTAPKDLFQIEKPGTYTLQIEMQMFRYTASPKLEDWTTNLLRFSPITVTVLRE